MWKERWTTGNYLFIFMVFHLFIFLGLIHYEFSKMGEVSEMNLDTILQYIMHFVLCYICVMSQTIKNYQESDLTTETETQ